MGVGSDAGNSGWVAGDDWYTRIEVTWNSDDTSCTYTATVKVYSAYWTNRYSGVNYNINIAGNQKSGSEPSPQITPGNWATIASHSATVYRNHSSQTFAISGWVGASSGSSSYTSGATAWWPASSHPLGALASYAVTYNANGGSSAPGSQTKWFKEDLTLSTSQPTRDGHTFKGWATSSGGSVAYSPGAKYTDNAALTLYAVWQVLTYTVSYNANGGSDAPGSQTKTWGQNLTLSSTKPTRSLYNFKGWGTSSGSTSASYQPGGTYSTNAAITLYAVWEVAWVAPRITNVSVYRSDADKNASDDGTCITVKFNWATDNAVATCRASVDGTWQDLTAGGTKSGSVSQVLSGTYSAESSHTVSINVADSTGGSTVSATVPTTHYIMDVSKVGAVGFNTVANSSTKRMDVNMPVYTTGVLSATGAISSGGNISAAGGKISAANVATSVHAIPYMSGSGKWLKLGWWDGASYAQSLVITMYTGNGWNSCGFQNTVVRIMVKNGGSSTASSSFGGSLEVISGNGQNASDMQLALPASSNTSTDVYVYMPWQYIMGWMTATCNGGTWHADVKETSGLPSGYTTQDVVWAAPTIGGLYWSGSTLGGMCGVQLWSGTLSNGGSITVSNLSKYRVVAVTFSQIASAAIGFVRSDSVYFTCATSVDDGYTTYGIRASFQRNSTTGTTVTLRSASQHVAGSAQGSNLTVTSIIGII